MAKSSSGSEDEMMVGLQRELTNELQGIFEGLTATCYGYDVWQGNFASLLRPRQVELFREVLGQLLTFHY